MATVSDGGQERARDAAARAAAASLEPGMTIGLGSGRAVWRVVDAIVERWPKPPLRAASASTLTDERLRAAGIETVGLEGEIRLDIALDGADEVDPGVGLLKGGGGALLREKLVIAAAERFHVVAETGKRVSRLGEQRALPVEIVRFGWSQTRQRVLALMPEAVLRATPDGNPFVTDEGHYLLDCPVPDGVAIDRLGAELKAIVGVVEHGLFLDEAELAFLGTPEGEVEVLKRH